MKTSATTFPILVKFSRMLNEHDQFDSGPVNEGRYVQGRSVADDTVTFGKALTKDGREAVWNGACPGYLNCDGDIRLSESKPPLHAESGEIVATSAASQANRLGWIVETDEGQRELWIGDADGRSAERIDTNGLEPDSCALSPDGKRVAFTINWHNMMQEALYCKEVDEQKTVLPLVAGSCCDPTWSPDGKSIAFTDYRRHIKVYDVESGDIRTVADAQDGVEVAAWERDGLIALSPAFSPDSSRILFITAQTDVTTPDSTWNSSDLRVVSAAGGVPVTLLSSDDLGPMQIAPCYGPVRKPPAHKKPARPAA